MHWQAGGVEIQMTLIWPQSPQILQAGSHCFNCRWCIKLDLRLYFKKHNLSHLLHEKTELSVLSGEGKGPSPLQCFIGEKKKTRATAKSPSTSGSIGCCWCCTFVLVCTNLLVQSSCSSLVVQNSSCVIFSCFPCVILHAKQNEHDRNIQQPLGLMTSFHSTGCDATGRQWIHTLLLISNWNRSGSHSWMEALILSRFRRHWCSKESIEDL